MVKTSLATRGLSVNAVLVVVIVSATFSAVVEVLLITVLLMAGGTLLVRNLALALAVVFFLAILAVGRWLVKNGAPGTGIGCIGSTFLTAGGLTAASLLSDASFRFGVLGCGLVGWFVCFCTLIPFMAEREERCSVPKNHGIDADEYDDK